MCEHRILKIFSTAFNTAEQFFNLLFFYCLLSPLIALVSFFFWLPCVSFHSSKFIPKSRVGNWWESKLDCRITEIVWHTMNHRLNLRKIGSYMGRQETEIEENKRTCPPLLMLFCRVCFSVFGGVSDRFKEIKVRIYNCSAFWIILRYSIFYI